MVNEIPPDNVDDVPVVEPNQHDDVPIVPEPILVDEDEDPEEDEFEEEEDPQEEEDDMEVDIEEDKNEPDLPLIFPYVEANPLNPPPPASDSEFEDVVEVEDMVEHEDETVSNSLHEVGESSTATFLQEDGDSLLPSFMRRDINSIFGRIASLTRRLKKELEDARSSNTLLCMQKERIERDLYWTRVQAHEFYHEMIRRGVVFEERLNEAINVPVKDEESPSSEPRGSPHDS
ncbi:hypothetical protein Tco_0074110 [Tanacetum coccineum]